MDYQKILRRAWYILWQYRVLWVFGFLLALTGGGAGAGGGGGGGGGNGNGGRAPVPDELQREFGQFGERFAHGIPADVASVWVSIAIAVACLIVLIFILWAVLRYVSETALIRMVDAFEETGERRGVREGFRLGWSRSAWRLFLIDLAIWLPAVVVFTALLLVSFGPLLAWTSGNVTLGIVSTILAIGLFSFGLLVVFFVGIGLVLLSIFARRVCALEQQGVLASIERGVVLVRQHLVDVVVMGVIVFAINVVTAILFIPIAIPLVLLAAVFGGVPALATGLLVGSVVEGALPWILAVLIGVPLFIFAIVVPLTFLSGLVEVYKSATWTLTYRELRTT